MEKLFFSSSVLLRSSGFYKVLRYNLHDSDCEYFCRCLVSPAFFSIFHPHDNKRWTFMYHETVKKSTKLAGCGKSHFGGGKSFVCIFQLHHFEAMFCSFFIFWNCSRSLTTEMGFMHTTSDPKMLFAIVWVWNEITSHATMLITVFSLHVYMKGSASDVISSSANFLLAFKFQCSRILAIFSDLFKCLRNKCRVSAWKLFGESQKLHMIHYPRTIELSIPAAKRTFMRVWKHGLKAIEWLSCVGSIDKVSHAPTWCSLSCTKTQLESLFEPRELIMSPARQKNSSKLFK